MLQRKYYFMFMMILCPLAVTKTAEKILKHWGSAFITKLEVEGKMETNGIESIIFGIDKLRMQPSRVTLYTYEYSSNAMYSRVNGFVFYELMENPNIEI